MTDRSIQLKLEELDKKLNIMQKYLERLDTHITKVEYIYSVLRSPFNYIMNSLGLASAPELPDYMCIENNA